MLVRCTWNRKTVNCNAIFEEKYIGYGRCCSFNYVGESLNKTPIRTESYGIFTGLKVWIKPHYNIREYSGVLVQIDDSRDLSYKVENRKFLSLGTVNYIHVQASKKLTSPDVKRLSNKQRNCVYGDERKLKYFKIYTNAKCAVSCKAEFFYKLCQCVPHYYGFVNDKPMCGLNKLPCIESNTEMEC
ncbi:sodium channel protein Nach-like [Sitophilus oryzae]|uniref:Sodium channel protein Nach-like n=1 Tax=Sitophilus oryzae TaxID=7048 RepID=A0A6J2Y1N1_SITOR|nr:sodium channel protein Nach-like [Sitophilus oryzae]